MLKWAAIFALVALFAGALGFTGTAGEAAGLAQALFVIALAGFVVFLALAWTAGRGASGR